MIKVNVKARKNPLDKSVKYYIAVAPVNHLNLVQIAKVISDRCTVTEPDVLAVLNSLQTEVIRAMQNGQSVRLGQLGSFRPTLASKGVSSKDAASTANVKALRCRFTMGSRLRSSLALTNSDVQFSLEKTNA